MQPTRTRSSLSCPQLGHPTSQAIANTIVASTPPRDHRTSCPPPFVRRLPWRSPAPPHPLCAAPRRLCVSIPQLTSVITLLHRLPTTLSTEPFLNPLTSVMHAQRTLNACNDCRGPLRPDPCPVSYAAGNALLHSFQIETQPALGENKC